MDAQFSYDVFLSHSAKDKAVVRVSSLSASTGERVGVRCRNLHSLRKDGLKLRFDEWVIPVAASRQSAGLFSEKTATEKEKDGGALPKRRYEELIEGGLEHSRVLVLCMSAHAFSSDWAQLEAGMFRFRDPLNKERRFIPLRLDNAPIQGSLAQFLYINWLPANREQKTHQRFELNNSWRLYG